VKRVPSRIRMKPQEKRSRISRAMENRRRRDTLLRKLKRRP
jgi:hypothetical protein